MEFVLEHSQTMVRSISVIASALEVNQAIDKHIKEDEQNDSVVACNKHVSSCTLEKYSAEKIQEKVQAALANLAIEQANKAYCLYPVNRVIFEGEMPMRDNIFSFRLHYEVLPEILLPKNLDKLSISVQEPTLDTKEYHYALQRLRRSQAQFQDVTEKRLPQDTDVVFLSIQGSYKGTPLLGMEQKSMIIPLEAHYQESPELASVARTLTVGERSTTTMQLPDDYPDVNLRGQSILIDLYLDDIKVEILPKVEDSFAIVLGFKNMKQLQNHLCNEILNKNIIAFQRVAEETLLKQVMSGLDFPLPNSLFSMHKKGYLLQARHYYSQLGFTSEEIQKKLQACQGESEQVATKKAKEQAFLMALGYREKIVVSTSDIDQEIEKLAKQNGHAYKTLHEKIATSNAIYELQDTLLATKAMHLLYKKAKKIIVDKQGKPVQKK